VCLVGSSIEWVYVLSFNRDTNMAIWFMFFEAAVASLSSRDYDVGGARGTYCNVAGLGTTTDWRLKKPFSFRTAESSGKYKCSLGGHS
jgi:hypothetical protein